MIFDQVVSLEPRSDGGRLLLSRDGGTSWEPIPATAFTFNGYNKVLFGTTGNPYASQSAFSGADEGAFQSAWATTHVDLSGLGLADGDVFQIAWDLATDVCGGWAGWWIDKVSVGYCSSVLPVEWLSFAASAEEERIELHWATAREVDNTGFWIERLIPAAGPADAWETLGWVPARGNGDAITEYSFSDRSAPAGPWCYYRLRQVDTDGTEDLSPVTKARLAGDPADWRIYPNPVSGPYLYLRAPDGENEAVETVIYDLTGREVRRQMVSDGRLAVGSLPPGAYYLSIATQPGAAPVVRRFLR